MGTRIVEKVVPVIKQVIEYVTQQVEESYLVARVVGETGVEGMVKKNEISNKKLETEKHIKFQDDDQFIEGFLDDLTTEYGIELTNFVVGVGINETITFLKPILIKKFGATAIGKIAIKLTPAGWVLTVATGTVIIVTNTDLINKCATISDKTYFDDIISQERKPSYFCGKLAARSAFMMAGIVADRLTGKKLVKFVQGKVMPVKREKLGVGKIILTIPQGLSVEKFHKISSLFRKHTNAISEDVFVHGSRASGTAIAVSDIDFGIRVSSKKFEELIQSSFRNAKSPSIEFPDGNAVWRTMQKSIETGKIQRGEAGLRNLGLELEQELGWGGNSVDISIIRSGSQFDQGPFIPLEK